MRHGIIIENSFSLPFPLRVTNKFINCLNRIPQWVPGPEPQKNKFPWKINIKPKRNVLRGACRNGGTCWENKVTIQNIFTIIQKFHPRNNKKLWGSNYGNEEG